MQQQLTEERAKPADKTDGERQCKNPRLCTCLEVGLKWLHNLRAHMRSSVRSTCATYMCYTTAQTALKSAIALASKHLGVEP